MPEVVLHDGSSFEGELLAESSSWRSGKPRWVEMRLYLSYLENSYIVELLGKSDWPGESTRHTVLVARHAEELPDVLHHPKAGGLTGTGRRLLEEAAHRDDNLRGLV